MKIINKILIIAAVLLFVSVPCVLADDWYEVQSGYFTIYDESGNELCIIGSFVHVGDQYISGDNNRYQVTSVDKANYTAQAEFVEYLGEYIIENDKKTGFEFLLSQIAQEDNKGSNKIGLYCTHSDESYVPTDGTESEPEEGGVFDVAEALKKALEERGCEVVMSENPHEPHDAGAYRRSRQTAVDIMEEIRPAILADIHRDAVPVEAYEAEVEGEEVSQVRMVIGASNQNKAANEDFAREIKQIADDEYPELIKDIYIGKGSYNQDLMPQCILFEMGTYTMEKEKVIESTDMLADVLATQMGVEAPKKEEKAEAAPDAGTKNGQPQDAEPKVEQQTQKRAGEENSGTWRSILLTLMVVSIVGLGVLFIYNSQGNRKSEFKSFWSEITSIGKRNGK